MPSLDFEPNPRVVQAPAQPAPQAAAVAPAAQGSVMERFRAQIVQVPAGRLPNGTVIAAMEADKYPVTQELWQEIMGSLPEEVQPNCPRCPVTHVNWEEQNGVRAEVQVFLDRLNQREAASGCRYDLPTDQELHYLIRGDTTGENRDPYSRDVTDGNVGQYVTSIGNSNHPDPNRRQIQPVGNKTPNAFGIELGNVWKMSKTIYDPAHPNLGRSVRGGSWSAYVGGARSGFRDLASAGNRNGGMSFSLVRRCGQ